MIGGIISRTLLAAPLLLLFFVAFNFIGSLFWFGGFFILLVALSQLLGEMKKGRRRVPLLVLSLATVALFFGACANHARAFGELSKATRAFAMDVHAQCNRDRSCPLPEAVCTPEAYPCRNAGSLGIQLSIRYHVDEDRKRFTVSSSMTSDESTTYTGGVARPLTRKFWMDGVDEENEPVDVIVPYDGGPAVAVDVDVDGGVDAGAAGIVTSDAGASP